MHTTSVNVHSDVLSCSAVHLVATKLLSAEMASYWYPPEARVYL